MKVFLVFFSFVFLSFSPAGGAVTQEGRERAYRRRVKEIIRLNSQCSALDKEIRAKERLRLAKRQLPLSSGGGGRHLILILEDSTQDRYLFKKTRSAQIEESASFLFRLAGVSIPANTSIDLRINGETVRGSLQHFLPKVEVLRDDALSSLGPRQIAAIQKQQVLDWLCSNFEIQFLRDRVTGDITGVDKDDAFLGRGLKKAELSGSFMPRRGYGMHIYNRLWQMYREGVVAIDLSSVFGMIDFIQDLDDAVFVGQYRALMEERCVLPHLITDEAKFFAARSVSEDLVKSKGKVSFHLLTQEEQDEVMAKIEGIGGFDVDEDEIIALAVARKNGLRDDFIDFYKGLARARGEEFIVPGADGKYDYAEHVMEYLKAMIAQRRQKLARIDERPGGEERDIQVITSGRGKSYLIGYAQRQKSLEETMGALRQRREETDDLREELAVSLYLLVLGSDRIADKMTVLDDLAVLDLHRLSEAWIKDLYHKCGESGVDHPDLDRSLELWALIREGVTDTDNPPHTGGPR